MFKTDLWTLRPLWRLKLSQARQVERTPETLHRSVCSSSGCLSVSGGGSETSPSGKTETKMNFLFLLRFILWTFCILAQNDELVVQEVPAREDIWTLKDSKERQEPPPHPPPNQINVRTSGLGPSSWGTPELLSSRNEQQQQLDYTTIYLLQCSVELGSVFGFWLVDSSCRTSAAFIIDPTQSSDSDLQRRDDDSSAPRKQTNRFTLTSEDLVCSRESDQSFINSRALQYLFIYLLILIY